MACNQNHCSMGFQPARLFYHSIRHLVTLLLCFLITWNSFHLIAEGRAIPKLKNQGIEAEQSQKKGEEKVVMVRLLIGSAPPRCERRCRSCGHCEAVQVPFVPVPQSQQKSRSRSKNQFFATPTIAYSRSDDISNYKPMSWMRKCGNFMLNP